MLTVYQAGEIGSAAIYDNPASFAAVLSGPAFGGSYVGLMTDAANKTFFTAFRGSVTLSDWLLNLEAAVPDDEKELGTVAHGFFTGTPALYAEIAPMIPPGFKWVIVGHSRGAGEGSDLAGYAMARAKSNPNAVPYACVFMGSPRPGCDTLNAQLRKVPVWASFQNRQGIIHDPVTDVPTWGEHARPLIALREERVVTDAFPYWGPLIEPHHFELYLRGIAKLTLPPIVA